MLWAATHGDTLFWYTRICVLLWSLFSLQRGWAANVGLAGVWHARRTLDGTICTLLALWSWVEVKLNCPLKIRGSVWNKMPWCYWLSFMLDNYERWEATVDVHFCWVCVWFLILPLTLSIRSSCGWIIKARFQILSDARVIFNVINVRLSVALCASVKYILQVLRPNCILWHGAIRLTRQQPERRINPLLVSPLLQPHRATVSAGITTITRGGRSARACIRG